MNCWYATFIYLAFIESGEGGSGQKYQMGEKAVINLQKEEQMNVKTHVSMLRKASA
jgi:hypothetical protein